MNQIIARIDREIRPQTHFEGCEEVHLLCAAKKEILKLEKICEILSKQLDAAYKSKRKKKQSV